MCCVAGGALPLQATLPESPRWLLLSGAGRQEALQALVRCEGKRASDLALAAAEVDEMADGLQLAAAASSSSSSSGGLLSSLGLELFSNSRYYRPLLVGMSLMLFQQVRGGPAAAAAAAPAAGIGQQKYEDSVVYTAYVVCRAISFNRVLSANHR
jgi:hypothetical protein